MNYKILISFLILIVLIICFRNYLPKISFFNNKPQTLESNINNYAKELAQYDEAIKLNPTNSKVYYDKGIALEPLGEYELAIKWFSKALDLDTTNSPYAPYTAVKLALKLNVLSSYGISIGSNQYNNLIL
ncbi:MAG TPA: tetratricopeptide repeat protein [Rickettsia endosymbiont of Ceroptres masudai]|nr:tetratricopeptide repeat protein [Rickettsia endosymbiont of Ceroptres masudai]